MHSDSDSDTEANGTSHLSAVSALTSSLTSSSLTPSSLPPSTLSPRERKTEMRKRLIAETLLAGGSATPQDLATKFGVSVVTIHRDLHELERRGMVRKFHGGVAAQPSGIFENQMSHRLASKAAEKAAIAAAALQYVEPGMSILLDDSTTTLRMIDGLADRTPLHVATTFVAGIRRLSELARYRDELTVVGIGGRYDVSHDSFLGVQALEQVAGIHVDAVFMSTSAVSATDLYHQEEQVVMLKRQMIASATKRYLLVDHTKLDRRAMLKIAPVSEFDLVITDGGAEDAVLAAWRERGTAFEVATVDGGAEG
jgi:DeoR/GlpR family transcriptional regulator of sugar metabolism